MSFDSHSELPPHLLALAHLTQWHSEAHQQPLEVRFTVHNTSLDSITCAVTGSLGALPPADYARSATVAAYEVARTGNFEGSYNVRINSSPGGQTIVKQMPLSPASEHETDHIEASAPDSASTVSNNGLRLRSALLARGHNSGYSPAEVAAEEKQRGFTFTPELKFYRALVRNGVVAEVAGQNVIASTPQADFGASTLDSAPWKAPEKTDGTVQAVLNHSLWLEIANSPSHLYAIDLAPGAQGTVGQVIARKRGDASVPVQVALSLADFVTGNLVGQDAGSSSPVPAATPAPQASTGTSTLAQTIAWVGTVEPIALPGFLGWTLAPTEARYRAVLAEVDPESAAEPEPAVAPGPAKGDEAPASEAVPTPAQMDDSEPVIAPAAPVVIKSTTTSENASNLFATQEADEPAPAPSATPDSEASPVPSAEEQGEAGVRTDGEPAAPTADGQGSTDEGASSPLSRAASAYAAAAFPNDLPVTTGEKAQDIRDIDPGVARVPASPEQKNIANTIGTLAFGTPEERKEYQSTDTDAVPSIAARAKKVSLASAQVEPQPPIEEDEQKQDDRSLRSALRKFFIGD
ncbi:hypothetical protein [Rothia nasimurium]|uniref:hypothetical protein n=1 Tax=Rothia nasimurium TaxID=85336 RepID=UPI001F43664A|nr:hypothetical protein [Rothia nasimurium]